jgi:hypothetical protein
MGMFDEVKVIRFYCFNCGAPVENKYWQTKDGDCVLERFDSLEDFGNHYYQLYHFSLTEFCTQCEIFLDYYITNTAAAHREYAAKKDKEWRDNIIKKQTNDHPNHAYSGYSGDGTRVWYSNAWCSICKEKGFEKGDENPEMNAEHKSEAKYWAQQQTKRSIWSGDE